MLNIDTMKARNNYCSVIIYKNRRAKTLETNTEKHILVRHLVTAE